MCIVSGVSSAFYICGFLPSFFFCGFFNHTFCLAINAALLRRGTFVGCDKSTQKHALVLRRKKEAR